MIKNLQYSLYLYKNMLKMYPQLIMNETIYVGTSNLNKILYNLVQLKPILYLIFFFFR